MTRADDGLADARVRALWIVDAFVRQHTGLACLVPDLTLAEMGISDVLCAALVSQLAHGLGRDRSGAGGGRHSDLRAGELIARLLEPAQDDSGAPEPSAAAEGHWPDTRLGPALDVTDTTIRFARGTFEHHASDSFLGLRGRLAQTAQLPIFLAQMSALSADAIVGRHRVTPWHEQLIADLRALYRTDVAMLHGSRTLANLCVIPSLAGPGDQLFLDAQCHQSIVDGSRASGAATHVYRHNDPDSFERLLRTTPRPPAGGIRMLLTESVFSLEGDLFDLPAFLPRAAREGCLLFADESCALGQVGPTGLGLEEHFDRRDSLDVRTGTLARGVAASGGYVACRAGLAARLREARRGRLLTPLSPLQAFIASEGVRLLRTEGRALKATLDRNADIWRNGLRAAGFDTGASSTGIMSITCPVPEECEAVWQRALEARVYVQPVRARSASPAFAALRSSVTAAHQPERLRVAAVRLRG